MLNKTNNRLGPDRACMSHSHWHDRMLCSPYLPPFSLLSPGCFPFRSSGERQHGLLPYQRSSRPIISGGRNVQCGTRLSCYCLSLRSVQRNFLSQKRVRPDIVSSRSVQRYFLSFKSVQHDFQNRTVRRSLFRSEQHDFSLSQTYSTNFSFRTARCSLFLKRTARFSVFQKRTTLLLPPPPPPPLLRSVQ